jgi:Sec-independent protein translocase protein TatA
MSRLGPTEIILIVAVILLMFGGKKNSGIDERIRFRC